MARIRYQCVDCKKRGKGGFFSVKNDEGQVACPYCGSTRVKRL